MNNTYHMRSFNFEPLDLHLVYIAIHVALGSHATQMKTKHFRSTLSNFN